MELRPIKVHCDEAMRAHLEFILRRHIKNTRWQLGAARMRGRVTTDNLVADIALAEKCLSEVMEAGT